MNNLVISLNAALPEIYKRDMHPYLFRYTCETVPEAYRGKQFAEDNTVARHWQDDFYDALVEHWGEKGADRLAEFQVGGIDIAKLALANRYMRRSIIG